MKKIIFILAFLGCFSLPFVQAQSSVVKTQEYLNESFQNAYGESIDISGVVTFSIIFTKSGQASFQVNAKGTGSDSEGNKYRYNETQNVQVSSSGYGFSVGKVQLICQGGCPNVSFELYSTVKVDANGNASLHVSAN